MKTGLRLLSSGQILAELEGPVEYLELSLEELEGIVECLEYNEPVAAELDIDYIYQDTNELFLAVEEKGERKDKELKHNNG